MVLLSRSDFVVAGLVFFVTHRRQLDRFAASTGGLALLDVLADVSQRSILQKANLGVRRVWL